MTRDSGDQPTRLTVAELLAQHGAKPGGTRHRHRRRAADDPEDESDVTTTAPQAIIDRIHAEQPESDRQPSPSNGHAHPARPDGQGGPGAQPHRDQRGYRSGFNPPVPPPAQRSPWKERSEPRVNGIGDRLDGFAGAEEQTHSVRPKAWHGGRPRSAERTDQFAAFEPESAPPEAGELNGWAHHPPAAAPARFEPHAPAQDDDYYEYYEYDQEYAEGSHDEWADSGDLLSEDDSAAPEAAEETEAGSEAGEEPSAGRQWLTVGLQLALGVVGGAVSWLIFNWMWTSMPAIALAAALIVIVGLVWIVRKIRKADDLQATVLAVLVGLIVTVSPAALLLLSR